MVVCDQRHAPVALPPGKGPGTPCVGGPWMSRNACISSDRGGVPLSACLHVTPFLARSQYCERRLLSSLCLFVRMEQPAPTGRISMKFDIESFPKTCR